MKCLNCGQALSCGCQKKVASNGQSVCGTCIAAYEAKIKGAVVPPKVNLATRIFK
jgi:transcription elongation factor Elf1